jgi:hypothetical protein
MAKHLRQKSQVLVMLLHLLKLHSEPVWFAAVVCLHRCGAAEAFRGCPVLAMVATTAAPKLRRWIRPPQVWRVFALGAMMAATGLL